MAKTARRCPRCSSTHTAGFGRKGVQLCDVCNYRWIPCSDQYCRGYRIILSAAPHAVGCQECDSANGGVPTDHVLQWPETYRAIARRLEEREEKRAALSPVQPEDSEEETEARVMM